MRRIALLVLVSAALLAQNFPEVSLGDMQQLVRSRSAIVLDCNGSDSYREGHLPGAIDYEANFSRLGQILPGNRGVPVVVYAGGPFSSAYLSGAQAVHRLGYSNVRCFRGGLSSWAQAGLPLER